MVARVGRDKFVEVWLIGSEGLVGAPVVLAAEAAPLHRRTVQVTGEALRIKASEFCELLETLWHLRFVVERYLAVVLAQTTQSGACNSFHSLKQRLARWLLIAQNATNEDEIPLTHGVLAELLGVRRARVTEGLEVFQKEWNDNHQMRLREDRGRCRAIKAILRLLQTDILPKLDIGSGPGAPVPLVGPAGVDVSTLIDREPRRPSE